MKQNAAPSDPTLVAVEKVPSLLGLEHREHEVGYPLVARRLTFSDHRLQALFVTMGFKGTVGMVSYTPGDRSVEVGPGGLSTADHALRTLGLDAPGLLPEGLFRPHHEPALLVKRPLPGRGQAHAYQHPGDPLWDRNPRVLVLVDAGIAEQVVAAENHRTWAAPFAASPTFAQASSLSPLPDADARAAGLTFLVGPALNTIASALAGVGVTVSKSFDIVVAELGAWHTDPERPSIPTVEQYIAPPTMEQRVAALEQKLAQGGQA